ncbi:MAG: hypothetical protein SGJ23_15935 [Alphaproteobacteria bacterium]|nr:hypothetical protein [Alphaproteobacteria bacterium]
MAKTNSTEVISTAIDPTDLLGNATDKLRAIIAIAGAVGNTGALDEGPALLAIEVLAKMAYREIDIVVLELGGLCFGNYADEFRRLAGPA